MTHDVLDEFSKLLAEELFPESEWSLGVDYDQFDPAYRKFNEPDEAEGGVMPLNITMFDGNPLVHVYLTGPKKEDDEGNELDEREHLKFRLSVRRPQGHTGSLFGYNSSLAEYLDPAV